MLEFKVLDQPLQEQDGTEDEVDVTEQLRTLTMQEFSLEAITRGVYILDENDLPDEYKELLHGRAFIVDRTEITEVNYGAPVSYYIAADKFQGLIVPARTLFVKSENSDAYYRWTDDGDKWTEWVTLQDGMAHTYLPQELCRFAEVQIYSEEPVGIITLRATR